MVLVDLWLSHNNKTIIFKLFDFLSPKFSSFRLRFGIRFMSLLRLMFRFLRSIFRLVLSLFIPFFSFPIVAAFVFSSLVVFWTVIIVSTFSIVVSSLKFLANILIFDWNNRNLTIISFCFAKDSFLIRFYLCFYLCGFYNCWRNICSRDRICNWLSSLNNRSWQNLHLHFNFRSSFYFCYFLILLQDSIYNLLLMRSLRQDNVISMFLNKRIQGFLQFSIIGEVLERVAKRQDGIIKCALDKIGLFQGLPQAQCFIVLLNFRSKVKDSNSSCKDLKFFQLIVSIDGGIFSIYLFEQSCTFFNARSFLEQIVLPPNLFYLLWLKIIFSFEISYLVQLFIDVSDLFLEALKNRVTFLIYCFDLWLLGFFCLCLWFF